MNKKKILVISGSTRKQSVNGLLINAIEQMGNNVFNFVMYEGISNLPYFNPDINDENIHPEVKQYRQAITQADAVLICTPEYVFSLPGILKNALEWTVSTMVFDSKPTAIITASSLGDKAHESLLLIMKTIGAQTNEAMALHISGARTKVNDQCEITDEDLKLKIGQMLNAIQQCFRPVTK